MKKINCLLLVLVMTAGGLQAQGSKVNSGVINLQNGNVGEAISKLEEALSKPELLKPKHFPKAHYNLAKAYLQVAKDTSQTELRALYPDAIMKAKNNYEKAMSHPALDNRTKNADKLDNTQNDLWFVLYNEAIAAFNNSQYDESLAYFKGAQEIREDHFLTSRMLGANYVLANDTANAVAALEQSIEIYRKKYVDEEDQTALTYNKSLPDFEQDSNQLSYIFQQLAVIYDAQGNARKALETVETGLEITGDDKALKRQELNIYNNHPELLEEAKEKFEAAIADDPKDLPIKLAYASLLERNDEKEKALELYQQAYDQDAQNLQANYGLGAYYINQAAALSEKKAKMTKEAEIKAMDEQIIELLEKGYPFMVKLHELQPKEVEWLRQLVNISGVLGKDEDMATYGKKLGEMNK